MVYLSKGLGQVGPITLSSLYEAMLSDASDT